MDILNEAGEVSRERLKAGAEPTHRGAVVGQPWRGVMGMRESEKNDPPKFSWSKAKRPIACVST